MTLRCSFDAHSRRVTIIVPGLPARGVCCHYRQIRPRYDQDRPSEHPFPRPLVDEAALFASQPHYQHSGFSCERETPFLVGLAGGLDLGPRDPVSRFGSGRSGKCRLAVQGSTRYKLAGALPHQCTVGDRKGVASGQRRRPVPSAS